MKQLTGVFLTDGVARSGESFTVPALEDILWKSYGKRTPSNVSHDVHRPIGISQVSSLYVSHEAAYVLGDMFLPQTQEERESVMETRTVALNTQMIERINQFSGPFLSVLKEKGLVVPNGEMMSNGIVMYGAKGLANKAFPFMTQDFFDRDGLVYFNRLGKYFDYKGCGVFAAKNSNLALLLHPYLRRSLSRFNNFNVGFIDMLIGADSAHTPIRLRIDDSYIGYTPSYVPNVEFEFWYGPSYSDDIMSIPPGLSCYVPNEEERFYNPVHKTEFIWENKDGKKQFEMEEVTDMEVPIQPGIYGCRYLHSFYDPSTGEFDHFDGAIRMYDSDLMEERKDKQMSEMGHKSNYTKLFRVDGKLPIRTWKGLITQYLRDNRDVYRYFGEEVPFIHESALESEREEKPFARYVPYVLAPGDGIRMLVSYHKPIEEKRDRFFSNLDTFTVSKAERMVVADLHTVDLAKCLRRAEAPIEYPECAYVDCCDGFANLPIVSHNGVDLFSDVNASMRGIKSFLSGLQKNRNNQCLSFGLSWNIGDDRSIVISVIGTVLDLSDWLNSFSTIPVDREDLRVWLDNQVRFIHQNGRDDSLPINADLIQIDGTFFQRRRGVQEDVEIADARIENGCLAVAMIFPEDKKDLYEAVSSKTLGCIQMAVVEEAICEKTGKNYLNSPFIAPFGETTCQIRKVLNMCLVWCRT